LRESKEGFGVTVVSAKDLVKLTQKKYRREMGLCIVEGEKLVKEHRGKSVAVFLRHDIFDKTNKTPQTEDDVQLFDAKIFDKVTGLETPRGILAVVPIPKPQKITFPYIVLDGIQDPGNVGTILRTAKALGYKTVFSINSADVWSQKVIRSASGTQFGMSIFEISHDGFLDIYNKDLKSSKLFIADMGGEIKNVADKNFGIVFGSEGSGVSAQIKNLQHEIISVPMSGEVESLNVAVASGILLFLLRQ